MLIICFSINRVNLYDLIENLCYNESNMLIRLLVLCFECGIVV